MVPKFARTDLGQTDSETGNTANEMKLLVEGVVIKLENKRTGTSEGK